MYLDSYVYPNANYGYEVIQRVPNVDAVSACRVPLDGRVSYFVLNDNSAICTKFIDMNGKAVIRKYVLQETPSNNKTIEERIANLESIVAQFNVGQCAQTAMIVNQLRPFPQPAYTVANPYVTPTATT